MTSFDTTSGRESFSCWQIIFENILFILNWGIGFILLMSFQFKGIPVVSFLYLILLLTVQVLLKKHNCSSCYYYGKWCHLGWGKISRILFEQNSGNLNIGKKLSISYILQLPLITLFAIIAGLIYGYTFWSVGLLIIFILVNILQVVLRKPVCKTCKMRFTCAGSAAKT